MGGSGVSGKICQPEIRMGTVLAALAYGVAQSGLSAYRRVINSSLCRPRGFL